MIGKILFTIGVILVVALIWRTRMQGRLERPSAPRLVNPPAPARRWPVRGLAIGAGALMVVASALLLLDYWRDRNEVIFIRVVDAASGRSTSYQAQRGDIRDREFVTTDGRRIVLAETERLETSTIRSPSTPGRN
jgi:hypothetical protein